MQYHWMEQLYQADNHTNSEITKMELEHQTIVD